MDRRTFCSSAAALAFTSYMPGETRRAPKILLRSSWQVFNIGDIAHTPGVLTLLEKYIPHAETTLWASGDLSEAVAAMEHQRFPKLKIVKGRIDTNGRASNADLAQAIAQADFFLHGSGPSLVAEKDLSAFVQHTGKPFGIYGITYGGSEAATRALISKARFAYFRDSQSLAKAKADGITAPIMDFSPDGAFATDLANAPAAAATLRKYDLTPGKFLCCLTRYRKTPYWKYRGQKATETDLQNLARNNAMKEQDAAPLREAIMAIVRETDLKIFLVPEDLSQMDLTREMLYDKLPADVQKRVVHKSEFWLTDEALSVYRQSAGLFGAEMHSPIMAVGNGIPALVCRWQEQTTKGIMWKDIGLGDWLFDFDQEEDRKKMPGATLAFVKDRAGALEKTAKARAFVENRLKETMAVVAKQLPGG
jgi:polysaccharide pyruvyl transferase WcaK-like protein